MPLTPIDYSKTIIYKIISNDLTITDVYVGSTTDFTRRKNQHKSSCNNINDKKYNLKLYQFIRSNGGWDSFSMIQIEKCNCSNGNESRAKERYWYELFNAKLNTVHPGAYANGEKEYKKKYREEHSEKIKIYEENRKEQRKEQYKIYYQKNKDNLKERKKIYNETNKEHIMNQHKIYLQENKEHIKEYSKNYRQQNKDKIKKQKSEPFLCDCGCIITHQSKAKHQKTQKHINLMKELKTDDVLII